MLAFDFELDRDDDVAAHLTDIAYQALLRRGLQRSFLDVELELWTENRAALAESPARPVRQRPQVRRRVAVPERQLAESA